MRAILDVNVLVSALLSPNGAPAQLLVAWKEGRYELLVSPLLLEELERSLSYPKIRKRIDAVDAERFVEALRASATVIADPDEKPPLRSPDPGDDYLLTLAATENAPIVSGDRHLLELDDRAPVFSPRSFLATLEG